MKKNPSLKQAPVYSKKIENIEEAIDLDKLEERTDFIKASNSSPIDGFSQADNKEHMKENYPPTPGCKRPYNDNKTLMFCDVCNKWFKNERELRLHKTNIHITEEGLVVGMKRDESFMTKSNSLSPTRKRRILEPKSKFQTINKTCKDVEQEPDKPVQEPNKYAPKEKDPNNDIFLANLEKNIDATVDQCSKLERKKQR